MASRPMVRWGIITTGMVASWFVEDIVLDRPDAIIKHVVQAIGSSSTQKGKDFVAKFCPNEKPSIYDSYHAVYEDSEVDIIYIGTPHGFHKRDCLDAIAAGKAVLCEKAFTINARQAQEVLDAARAKNVYVHEAMWLRHRPLVKDLQRLIHKEKVIGDVYRTFCDFSLDIDVPNLPAESRYKDPNLGAGTVLDIGIYALTWAILSLDPGSPGTSEKPTVLATQSHLEGIEVTTSVLVQYPSTGRQGVVTASTMGFGDPDIVARIQGTKGFIEVYGPCPSEPLSFAVFPKSVGVAGGPVKKGEGKLHEYPQIGRGFTYEADATASDFLAGRKENATMPWSETMLVMELLDEIRRQGGTRYPVDDTQ